MYVFIRSVKNIMDFRCRVGQHEKIRTDFYHDLFLTGTAIQLKEKFGILQNKLVHSFDESYVIR